MYYVYQEFGQAQFGYAGMIFGLMDSGLMTEPPEICLKLVKSDPKVSTFLILITHGSFHPSLLY